MHLIHKWKPVHVFHYVDVSYGDKAKSTSITSVCQKCHKIKEFSIYGAGWIELESLQ